MASTHAILPAAVTKFAELNIDFEVLPEIALLLLSKGR